MCGIAGVLDANLPHDDELRARATAMAGALTHRGPDDSGVWTDGAAGVGLGFRRLSIIDLSPTGHQPMVSSDGSYVLVFNGEMYNHRALRRELEAAGTTFRGTSDTEVLLEAIAEWGPRRAIERANGMFALACWDRQEHSLLLARDRFGEKPLYYGWCGRTFLFGSEVKALRAHPAFRAGIDRDALAEYFRYAHVPAPKSIYEGLAQLPPGCLLRVDGTRPGVLGALEPYWSAVDVALEGVERGRSIAGDDAVDAVDEALRASVALRMVADVPVGAFLSGGMDSSLVVALMQAQSDLPARTFTIGFHAPGFDEAQRGRAVAEHLGTDHTELYVTPAEALAVVPRLPTIYDEPFADSSQIPTFLVSQLARRDVTVALTGDGGDELFGGYTRYFVLERIHALNRLPRPVRAATAAVLRSQPPQRWDRLARGVGRVARARIPAQPGQKIHKLAGALSVGSPDEVYRSLIECWQEPLVLGADGDGPRAALPLSPLDGAMLADTVAYLPDDLLVKVDRASMAVSLEARVPMLDPNVFALAWSLAPESRVRRGSGKRALRSLLHRYLPARLVEGPKTGFGVPLAEWLRGPLRPWAEDLLAPDRLAAEGYLDGAVVQRAWTEHLAGTAEHHHRLWAVLMFEAWLEAQRDQVPAPTGRA